MINFLLDKYISVNYKIIPPEKPEFNTASGYYLPVSEKYLFILDINENRLYPIDLIKELDTIFYIGEEMIKKHIEKWVKTLKTDFDLENYWSFKHSYTGSYSVAMGRENTASGYCSIAFESFNPRLSMSSRYSSCSL